MNRIGEAQASHHHSPHDCCTMLCWEVRPVVMRLQREIQLFGKLDSVASMLNFEGILLIFPVCTIFQVV